MAMAVKRSAEICIRRLLQSVVREARHHEGTNMVLLGRPGAGKGTYGSRLAKLLNAPHISTGDLIREELKKQSPVAEFISQTVSSGKLLGDETVVELLRQRLERGAGAGEKGFILDGFPRTVKQAEILKLVAPVDLVVNFVLDEEALVKKCLGRRICGECGQVFSLADVTVGEARMPAMLPPMECLSKMVIRKDDNEESIRRRLQVYEAESKPVEEYYRQQGKLVDFDVFGSVEENWARLLESLKLKQQTGSDDLKRPVVVRSASCSRQQAALL